MSGPSGFCFLLRKQTEKFIPVQAEPCFLWERKDGAPRSTPKKQNWSLIEQQSLPLEYRALTSHAWLDFRPLLLDFIVTIKSDCYLPSTAPTFLNVGSSFPVPVSPLYVGYIGCKFNFLVPRSPDQAMPHPDTCPWRNGPKESHLHLDLRWVMKITGLQAWYCTGKTLGGPGRGSSNLYG